MKGIFSRVGARSGTASAGKVTKVLGPESADDIAKGIISGEIVLMPAEYSNFWNSITKERATCARYMARIVILLLSFEKDPARTEKSLANKKYGTSENFITLLLNTLQFLDMFVGYDPSTEAFVSAMENYEQAKHTTPMFRNKRIDDGLYGLARRRANRGQAAVKMLVDCSTLESEEEMRHSACTVLSSGASASASSDRPDAGDLCVESGIMDFPFTFTALTRMSRAEVSPLIFDEVLKQLEGAGSALSSMAAMQGRTLALMFMLREFLTISPTADQAWMQRACEVLIGLYKWPKPYGVVARELLDFVSMERRSPGCHLRERLFAENPELLPPSMRTQHDGAASRHHAVYLFLDKTQPLCCTNKYLLLSDVDRSRSGTIDSSSSKHISTSMRPLGFSGSDDSREKLFSLQRDILLHILDLDFHVRDKAASNQKSPGANLLNLASMDNESIARWYVRALEVVERAKSLPVTSEVATAGGVELGIPGGLAKMYRESYLGSLLAEICPDRQFSPRRSTDEVKRSRRNTISRPGSLSFPLPLEEMQTTSKLKADSELSLETGEDEAEGDTSSATDAAVIRPQPPETELVEPLLFGQQAPTIPDITFRVFDVEAIDAEYGADTSSAQRLDTMEVTQKYSYLRNALGYVHVFQDTDEIMRMMSEALTSWTDLRGGADSQFDADHKLIVKAVLMGCDTVIHRFLCGYVVLLTDHPDMTSKIQLELYLVPVGPNKLGTYLARSDKWYRRHIYDSFKGGLGLCPQYPFDTECSAKSMSESGMEKALPVTSLRKLLQDYVRQAKNKCAVCVFEVLCWAAAEECSGAGCRDSTGSREENDPSRLLSQQASPDIVIPFMMQIEIGINAQIARHRQMPLSCTHSRGVFKRGDIAMSTKEILGDKDVHIAPVELSVSYILASMSSAEASNTSENSGSKNDCFASLSFSNFPVSRSSRDDVINGIDCSEKHTVPNGPQINFLVMQSQPCKGMLADTMASRRRNQRSVEAFMECLRDPETLDAPHPISAVEVDVVNTRDKFHILVDGAVYGPFRRIVIRSCQVGVTASQPMMTVPIMTHMPMS